MLCGAVTAFGFAAFADGSASAALWRFLQGAAFGGAHMPGMRALCDAVPPERQTRSIAVYTASFAVGSACPTPFREPWPRRLVGVLGLRCSPPARSPRQRSPGSRCRRCRAPPRRFRAGCRRLVQSSVTARHWCLFALMGCTTAKSRRFVPGSSLCLSLQPIGRAARI
jgi:hypothetical protein